MTIAGSDFAGVKEVRFGSLPASSFKVISEAEITAVAPAVASAGPTDVSVTTVAGKSPSVGGDRFAYEAPPTQAAPPPPASQPAAPATCLVPKLTGKKLKGARKALAAAKCKLGKVTRTSRKASKVAGQSPKPGATKTAGAAVNVSLG
ncbi:MAG: PASTA domain-containing protein [Solirubrobacterales bacterium]